MQSPYFAAKCFPQWGRRPSASQNPYSSERPHELNTRPDFFVTFGSAASAATARPAKSGVSEARKSGSFFPASCQLASATPKWSSIASERRKPGVSATAATFLRRNSRAYANARRIAVVFTRS